MTVISDLPCPMDLLPHTMQFTEPVKQIRERFFIMPVKPCRIAVPSTMGTLMSSGLMQAGKKLRGNTEPGLAEYAALFEGYAEGVMSLGKAKVGDKTFLDGMVPAVEAMNAAKEAGKDVKTAAREAKRSCRKGL